jgi:hypothetical protein
MTMRKKTKPETPAGDKPAAAAIAPEAEVLVETAVAAGPPPATLENAAKKFPWRFQPGKPGGPGRPLGARNKLTEDFLRDTHEVYQQHGRGILVEMATSKKMSDRIKFVEIVHDLLPKHAAIDVNVAPSLPKDLAEMEDADWRMLFGIEVKRRE